MTFASRLDALAARRGKVLPSIAGLRGVEPSLRWFHGREPRERWLILVGGAVVIAYVAFAGLWQPLAGLRARALADIARYEAIAARIAAAGPDLGLATARSSPLPDAAVMTDSAAVVGLVIRRLEPEGERTRIELEDADFAVLVAWLERLETDHGLKVATIEIDRRPSPGVVTARISVVR